MNNNEFFDFEFFDFEEKDKKGMKDSKPAVKPEPKMPSKPDSKQVKKEEPKKQEKVEPKKEEPKKQDKDNPKVNQESLEKKPKSKKSKISKATLIAIGLSVAVVVTSVIASVKSFKDAEKLDQSMKQKLEETSVDEQYIKDLVAVKYDLLQKGEMELKEYNKLIKDSISPEGKFLLGASGVDVYEYNDKKSDRDAHKAVGKTFIAIGGISAGLGAGLASSEIASKIKQKKEQRANSAKTADDSASK